MKLPSLRTTLFLQAGVVLLIPLFFLAWQVYGLRSGIGILTVILAGNFFQQWLTSRVKKQLDECALQTLRVVESGCMDTATAILVLAAGCLLADFSFCRYMPTILAFGVFVVYLERALLFTYWDKRGLA